MKIDTLKIFLIIAVALLASCKSQSIQKIEQNQNTLLQKIKVDFEKKDLKVDDKLIASIKALDNKTLNHFLSDANLSLIQNFDFEKEEELVDFTTYFSEQDNASYTYIHPNGNTYTYEVKGSHINTSVPCD